MQLNLNEDEIKLAIEAYIDKEFVSLDNKSVTIDLIAGRGKNGHKADITIDVAPATTTTSVTGIHALDESENNVEEKSFFSEE